MNAPPDSLLSAGVDHDNQEPMPISLRTQPTSDIHTNDQKGSFYSVQRGNVDQASVVPGPGDWLLLSLGLVLIAWRISRR